MKTEKIEQSYYDSIRVNLLLNLGWSVLILLTTVITINFFNERYSIVPGISAMLSCLVGIVYLKKTRNYRTVGAYAAIFGVIIIGATFFLLRDTLHYTTPMWVVLHICVVFFIMGYRWGTWVLAIHFVTICVFVFSLLSSNIQNIEPFTDWEKVTFCIEFLICGFGIGFTLRASLKSLNMAQSHSIEQNETLQKQFDLISKQNQEKEIMLQEIHHRVKNNLQLVSSLLNIQKNNIAKNETPFEDSISRVRAMALIHEKYYADDVSQHFSLKDYLEHSTHVLVNNYTDGRPVQITFEGDEVIATQDSITPMALLFNELVLGSMKRRKSVDVVMIKVVINRIENNQYEISYQDNADWKTLPINSTGELIIGAMMDQLDGTLLRNNRLKEGLDCLAVFPCPMERFNLDEK